MNDSYRPFDKALTQAVLAQFADIPIREEDIFLTFSDDFEQFARRLIRKTRGKLWRYVNSTAKKLLIAAIIISLLATSALAYGPIRNFIFQMNLRDNGSYYSFTFNPEIAAAAPDIIQEVYFPTYVPEGFVEEYKEATVGRAVASWRNEDGSSIFYTQNTIDDDPRSEAATSYNAEDAISEIILLGEYEVFRIKAKTYTMYIWTDHRYYYDLIVDDCIGEETMRKIFESIELAPDQEIIGAEYYQE